MALITPTTLTADVWTKVLTNVTATGQVVVVDKKNVKKPTQYLYALVTPTGADAPTVDYEGGIEFSKSIQVSNNVAMDVYVMPVNFDGTVMIFT